MHNAYGGSERASDVFVRAPPQQQPQQQPQQSSYGFAAPAESAYVATLPSATRATTVRAVVVNALQSHGDGVAQALRHDWSLLCAHAHDAARYAMRCVRHYNNNNNDNDNDNIATTTTAAAPDDKYLVIAVYCAAAAIVHTSLARPATCTRATTTMIDANATNSTLRQQWQRPPSAQSQTEHERLTCERAVAMVVAVVERLLCCSPQRVRRVCDVLLLQQRQQGVRRARDGGNGDRVTRARQSAPQQSHEEATAAAAAARSSPVVDYTTVASLLSSQPAAAAAAAASAAAATVQPLPHAASWQQLEHTCAADGMTLFALLLRAYAVALFDGDDAAAMATATPGDETTWQRGTRVLVCAVQGMQQQHSGSRSNDNNNNNNDDDDSMAAAHVEVDVSAAASRYLTCAHAVLAYAARRACVPTLTRQVLRSARVLTCASAARTHTSLVDYVAFYIECAHMYAQRAFDDDDDKQHRRHGNDADKRQTSRARARRGHRCWHDALACVYNVVALPEERTFAPLLRSAEATVAPRPFASHADVTGGTRATATRARAHHVSGDSSRRWRERGIGGRGDDNDNADDDVCGFVDEMGDGDAYATPSRRHTRHRYDSGDEEQDTALLRQQQKQQQAYGQQPLSPLRARDDDAHDVLSTEAAVARMRAAHALYVHACKMALVFALFVLDNDDDDDDHSNDDDDDDIVVYYYGNNTSDVDDDDDDEAVHLTLPSRSRLRATLMSLGASTSRSVTSAPAMTTTTTTTTATQLQPYHKLLRATTTTTTTASSSDAAQWCGVAEKYMSTWQADGLDVYVQRYAMHRLPRRRVRALTRVVDTLYARDIVHALLPIVPCANTSYVMQLLARMCDDGELSCKLDMQTHAHAPPSPTQLQQQQQQQQQQQYSDTTTTTTTSDASDDEEREEQPSADDNDHDNSSSTMARALDTCIVHLRAPNESAATRRMTAARHGNNTKPTTTTMSLSMVRRAVHTRLALLRSLTAQLQSHTDD